MLNFSVLFLLRNSNVRAILRNPPKYRHKLISFQSSTCAFEVQNQYILKRFLYSYYSNLAKIFEQTCNNIAKESYNLHLYLKSLKNLLVSPSCRTCSYSCKLSLQLRVNWCLPRKNGWFYRVRSMTSPQNEKNISLLVTRTPISGYLKVSINNSFFP